MSLNYAQMDRLEFDLYHAMGLGFAMLVLAFNLIVLNEMGQWQSRVLLSWIRNRVV